MHVAPFSAHSPRRWLAVPLVLGWAGAIVAGGTMVMEYSFRPGRVGLTPVTWPAASSVSRPVDRPTLVVAMHSRCPCTLATIEQLSHILSNTADRPRVVILLAMPRDADEAWKSNSMVARASSLPDVELVPDLGGEESNLHGAMTSGYVVLYNRDGRRVFSGGLTPSRGDAGESAGLAAVEAMLGGRIPGTSAAPVFGCELPAPHAAATAGVSE